MKIVFLGTPEPAAKILEELVAAGHEIACVVTQPDRPQGRGQKLSFSPVKEVALRLDLSVEQPEFIKNNKVFEVLLQSLKPDVGVVVAYGKILPGEILNIPKFGFVNVHASLLPKWRGAAPIQWALLKGEKETGVTIFKLTEILDAGPIIAQERLKIEDEDDAETLTKKLFELGGKLLLKCLPEIEKNKVRYIPQNESEVTFAPSITKESAEIDWKRTAEEIHNRIRALVIWPGAHTFYRGKRLKILKSKIFAPDLLGRLKSPGKIVQIVKNEGFVVAAGRGYLLITRVQPEAGKQMRAYDFVLGHSLKTDEVFPS
ncbi:MAG: methionyl-tRNA formyltransferase [Candidatus Margulisiibacteriota bacterium]